MWRSRRRESSSGLRTTEAFYLNRHTHIGAYGIIERDGMVLFVRKARGPYTGLLDLPGGGVEFGESPLGALVREILEETGLRVEGARLSDVASLVCTYETPVSGPEELHHIGLLYCVQAFGGSVRETGDGQDVLACYWADPSKHEEELSPLARMAVTRRPCT